MNDLSKYNIFYKLDENKNTIPCDMFECNNLLKNNKNIIKKEYIKNHLVSTIFMGINHQYGDGDPVLFETMIKDKKSNLWLDYQERYNTWKEAEEGHKKAVEWVKNGCKEYE